MAVACSLCLLRPFHGGGRRELVRRPKAYVFDTGLVCYGRGWRDIRDEDRGILWEHLVLDVLRAAIGDGWPNSAASTRAAATTSHPPEWGTRTSVARQGT